MHNTHIHSLTHSFIRWFVHLFPFAALIFEMQSIHEAHYHAEDSICVELNLMNSKCVHEFNAHFSNSHSQTFRIEFRNRLSFFRCVCVPPCFVVLYRVKMFECMFNLNNGFHENANWMCAPAFLSVARLLLLLLLPVSIHIFVLYLYYPPSNNRRIPGVYFVAISNPMCALCVHTI